MTQRAQRGSPSSARPDLPEHAPSYPAQAAIAAATKPDPVVIADPCKQVRWVQLEMRRLRLVDLELAHACDRRAASFAPRDRT
jgi:hypothetical protein